MPTLRKTLIVSLILVLIAGMAMAQTGTSSVRGAVSDPSGSVIANATVTLISRATGAERTQTTNQAGNYAFELVSPGEYRVEAQADGFQKAIVEAVHALIGKSVDVDVKLVVGAANQEITVSAESAQVQVNTTDASLGNNFVSEQISSLPLEAKDIRSLLTLQPGVTGSPQASGYVAGARSDQSNLTLDGVDINEAQSSALDSPVVRLNTEAIQEFRVTTMGLGANEGRSSAAQVNLVTKSGTNSLHGSLFWFHRNTIFTANDFFNNRSNVPRPKLLRNTFGPAVGGPIIKNKLFFFVSYEGRRDASQSSVARVVPLASLGKGQLRVLTCPTTNPNCGSAATVTTLTTADLTSIFPSVGINPAAVTALGAAAARYGANDFTVGDSQANQLLNSAGFRFNSSTPVRLNSTVARLDWNISTRQTLFLRSNVQDDHQALDAAYFPDTTSPQQWNHPIAFVAGHTWTMGANLINNLRYGYTRQAFSNIGDTTGTAVSFRFIFQPTYLTGADARTLSRTTPVQNITDDVSWVKGNHTWQFGTNIRLISNSRLSLANSFDAATTNPSGYQQGGNVVSDPIAEFLANQGKFLVSVAEAQNAATALIGRFSQYTANYIFGHDGSLQPVGTASNRTFATQAYDFYAQDYWKARKNLTFTLGVRYSLGRPVYETHGFEVQPSIPLGVYFENRVNSAAQGTPYNNPVSLQLSGPANHGKPMYNWDRNNFQPRVGVAYSVDDKTVFRGGFAMTNDYYGEALATFFDLNNQLGFSSQDSIPVNTYNVTSKPAPLFSGFGQNIRSLPRLNIPTAGVKFPLTQPLDMGERIESSLDSNLVAPTEYTFNFTFERQLPRNMVFQASYLGRMGRNLLAQRDAMALNDLKDPKSGMDWYTAATTLEKIRQTRPPGSTAVSPIPYFENVFPSNLRDVMDNYYGGVGIPKGFTPTQTIFWIARNFYSNDWTDLQADLDSARFALGQPTLFMQPQYGALSAWSTIANSNYSGLALSLRQRIKDLQWDFNYTWSHSLDDASGLQNADGFNYSAFILNPIRQRDYYANSDFDIRHQINVNSIYQLPFGKGKWLLRNAHGPLQAIVGGWSLSNIVRWNTGLPFRAPIDDARWATNWNAQSFGVLTQYLPASVDRKTAKLFSNPTAAYQSFRNPYPGESGQRNIFRLPGYANLDAGLTKAFDMPWSEDQKLQLHWEVFNVANHQSFGDLDTSRSGWGIRADPAVRNLTPPTNFANFTGIQGTPRVMQLGLRYQF
jgi:hypothetical protein